MEGHAETCREPALSEAEGLSRTIHGRVGSLLEDEEEGNLMKFEKNIAEIIRTIIESVQPERIILFGSRARGVAHRYSDYDIALAGVNMDHRVERHLKEALDDRLGIFAVDLIDIDKVDQEFKELIMQNGVVIYEN